MHVSMIAALSLALLASPVAVEAPLSPAQEEMIASAESAGPDSITDHATIQDWAGNVLREGTNDWTCLPDRPDTGGSPDPWCVDATWMAFIDAYANQREPEIDQVGVAYMLAGDAPVSNTDPYATEPTGEDDWVTGLGAHLMILAPDPAMLSGFPTDHTNGGPWIMWPDTPYVHLMVPIDSYTGGH